MKKALKKILSTALVLSVILSVSLSGVSALLVYDSVEETDRPYYDAGDHSCYYSWYSYYEQMTSVPLTGDGGRDAIAVALSQVGYLEGNSGDHTGVTGGSGNYTEFAAYMGHDNGYAWCATFCSWVYYVSGARSAYYSSAYWNGTYVPTWSSSMSSYGLRYDSYYAGGTYVPKTGDTVYFVNDWVDSGKFNEDHIGIVVYTDGNYVYTIEGNTSSQAGVVSEGGGVFFKKYSLWSDYIAGYGAQPLATVSDLPELDYSGENPTPGIYVVAETAVGFYSDTKYTSYGGMVVPMGTMFEVLDIAYDSNGAPLLYSKVKIGGSYYYGYILHGSGSNGCNRTLQIYANESKEPVISMTTDAYEINASGKIDTLGLKQTASSVMSQFTLSEPTLSALEIWQNGKKLSDDAYIGTGAEIRLIDSGTGEILETVPFIIKCDTDGDGEATALDYLTVKRHTMGTYTLEGDPFAAAAIINGKQISAFDYLLVKRAVLGTYIP